MNWIYHHREFTEDQIPEGAVGFVYMMTAFIGGHSYCYIGKKNFYADVKTKLGKKAMPTDKRKKTYKRVRKTVYQNYYSSNEILKQAHKEGVHITREILLICYSNLELSYQEVKHQFQYEVLEKDYFLNANILGRFYKQKK
jgi:hypothetical protein